MITMCTKYATLQNQSKASKHKKEKLTIESTKTVSNRPPTLRIKKDKTPKCRDYNPCYYEERTKHYNHKQYLQNPHNHKERQNTHNHTDKSGMKHNNKTDTKIHKNILKDG